MHENVILAFPRSGSHLFRFMFEILSEQATMDFTDKSIYQNEFTEVVEFNVNPEDIKWHKYIHTPEEGEVNQTGTLILILRNPMEAILCQSFGAGKENVPFASHRIQANAKKYFSIIDYYLSYKGNKKVFYYNDMIDNHEKFIRELYSFLGNGKENKLNYILSNYANLAKICSECEYSDWGGINSNSHNYWYTQLSDNEKEQFNDILNSYLAKPEYDIIAYTVTPGL